MVCGEDCNSCFTNKNKIIASSGYEVKRALDGGKSTNHYRQGELIFKEGFYAQGIFCLSKGKVMVTQTDSEGNEFIVQLYKEVEFLGLASFFSQKPYANNCIAIEDCDVCFFSGDLILKLMETQKDFAREVLAAISNQFIQSTQRTLALTKKSMRSRVADTLIDMHNVFGINEKNELNGYLKRYEMGNYACVSEANVIRILSDFQKENILTIKGKRIVINDLPALQKESLP